MISIVFRSHFDAAHQLALPCPSPCNQPHGHRYLVKIAASAQMLQHGMVVDFNILRKVVDEFDHCDLNQRPEFANSSLPTTAENIAQVLASKLAQAVGPRVSIDEVSVSETPHSEARWRPSS